MNKGSDFLKFVAKNKYSILLVAIVLFLSFLGVMKYIMEFVFTLLAIVLALYVGKRIQEDGEYIKKMFEDSKKNIYEYTVKEDIKSSNSDNSDIDTDDND